MANPPPAAPAARHLVCTPYSTARTDPSRDGTRTPCFEGRGVPHSLLRIGCFTPIVVHRSVMLRSLSSSDRLAYINLGPLATSGPQNNPPQSSRLPLILVIPPTSLNPTTMSSNIVLPDLPTWVQQHIQDVYSAKSDKDFNQAFDLFVAPDATIRLNGRQMQRDEYKKVLRGQTTGDARADIEFRDVVAAPAQVSTGPTVPVSAPLDLVGFCVVLTVDGAAGRWARWARPLGRLCTTSSSSLASASPTPSTRRSTSSASDYFCSVRDAWNGADGQFRCFVEWWTSRTSTRPTSTVTTVASRS